MYGQNRFFYEKKYICNISGFYFFLYIHKVSSCFCVFFDNTVMMYERKKENGKREKLIYLWK